MWAVGMLASQSLLVATQDPEIEAWVCHEVLQRVCHEGALLLPELLSCPLAPH